MASAARSWLELVEELPIDAQMEARDFVEFLLTKHGRAPGKRHQFIDGSAGLLALRPVHQASQRMIGGR